jgi:hypothetical protein
MAGSSTQENMAFLLEAQIVADLGRLAVLRLAKGALEDQDGAEAALVEATVLLHKVLALAEAIRPEHEQALSGAGIATQAAALRAQLDNLAAFTYKTNDVVCLKGALEGDHYLQVNGLPPITLGKRAFLVLRILARHAVARPGAFMTISEMLDAVSEHPGVCANQKEATFWNNPIAEDIHKAVSTLRDEIENAGGNRLLIESSETYGGGYRLSTPHYNIIVEDFDDE